MSLRVLGSGKRVRLHASPGAVCGALKQYRGVQRVMCPSLAYLYAVDTMRVYRDI